MFFVLYILTALLDPNPITILDKIVNYPTARNNETIYLVLKRPNYFYVSAIVGVLFLFGILLFLVCDVVQAFAQV